MSRYELLSRGYNDEMCGDIFVLVLSNSDDRLICSRKLFSFGIKIFIFLWNENVFPIQ